MTISLEEFLTQFAVNPAFRVMVLLTLGVILVNGWTDAPGAIASLVATGGMRLKPAIRMAAVFNLAGLLLMTAFNAEVAFTIYSMVDFGGNPAKALAALCAALTAVILWAAAAWCFGIPTSESHALIAGLSGAAVSLHHGWTGINGQEWVKVLYGLFFSTLFGFAFGWLGGKLAEREQRISSASRIKSDPPGAGINRLQKAGAAAMAFMHGAQDGQKFMGVFLLGISLAGQKALLYGGSVASAGQTGGGNFHVPVWMMLLCSVMMAAGTAIGGERIIRKVGIEMVALKKPQGIAADAAGAVCLFLLSLTGMPVSTTHVKTTAVMGVGIAGDITGVNMTIIKEMIFAWIITFPCCGLIGYLTARIFTSLI